MTIGLYVRVSSQEQAQEGYSIPAQKERLMAYCAAQGWTDFKFYIDEGVSAKDMNRPELQRLLEDVKKEKISMILVYRLDRFTRRVKDLYGMLETLEKYKCAFKSATEMYDTSNAMGRMFIGLVALLAQWETENLSERVKMALEEKVSGGERVGNIPYGFNLSENGNLIKNENESKVVEDMIEKFKGGMSANAISEYLNKVNNDRVWHPQGVLRVLRNPALYGATRWNDQVYENTHEGYVTKREFLKIQQMLDDRTLHHNREVEGTYLFQGILVCPNCQHIMTVNRYNRKKKDGTEHWNWCYKCQWCYKEGRKMLTIGEYRFEDALYEYMKNFEIPNEYVELVEEKDEHSLLLDQLQQIERKRGKFQRAWAADLMSDEEFEKMMDETRDIYEELKKKIAEYKAPVAIDVNALKNIVFTFNQSFSFLTQEEKRMFISQFIRKIEFKLVQQPPKDKRNKKGKDLVVLTNVKFY
jgi:DNA invertase Pin-like site-specific DNA recombinase